MLSTRMSCMNRFVGGESCWSVLFGCKFNREIVICTWVMVLELYMIEYKTGNLVRDFH